MSEKSSVLLHFTTLFEASRGVSAQCCNLPGRQTMSPLCFPNRHGNQNLNWARGKFCELNNYDFSKKSKQQCNSASRLCLQVLGCHCLGWSRNPPIKSLPWSDLEAVECCTAKLPVVTRLEILDSAGDGPRQLVLCTDKLMDIACGVD